MNSLWFVMAVTMVTWLGIFSYLLYLDLSLRRLENLHHDKESDDL